MDCHGSPFTCGNHLFRCSNLLQEFLGLSLELPAVVLFHRLQQLLSGLLVTVEPQKKPPLIRLEPITVSSDILIGEGGTLPQRFIYRVIKRHLPNIEKCVSSSQRVKIMASWTIGPKGKVVSVDSIDNPDKAIVQCLTQQISQMEFPAPLGGGTVTVNYPFFGKSKKRGPPSKATVQKAVEKRLNDLRYCNKQYSQEDHEQNIVLRWNIGSDGFVSETNILESSVTNQKLVDCIIRAVSDWVFPPFYQSQVVGSFELK